MRIIFSLFLSFLVIGTLAGCQVYTGQALPFMTWFLQ